MKRGFAAAAILGRHASVRRGGVRARRRAAMGGSRRIRSRGKPWPRSLCPPAIRPRIRSNSRPGRRTRTSTSRRRRTGRWSTLRRNCKSAACATTARGAAGFHSFALPAGDKCGPPANARAGNFPASACIGEEVRRNWASYQYIVSNGLYSFNGLEQAFKSGLKVDMPADSVEFKGDWVKVADLITWIKRTEDVTLTPASVRKLYYVNTATDGDEDRRLCVVSIHLSTKQIKNWVWSDFEHRLNPGRCDAIGCHDSFGAIDKDVQGKPNRNQDYGACQKTPALLAIMRNAGDDPVWENYCLKGSQATFVATDGKPTFLGDSVIERMNANIPVSKSSCITCHAYASFDKSGNFGLISFTTFHPQVGTVDAGPAQGLSAERFHVGHRQNDAARPIRRTRASNCAATDVWQALFPVDREGVEFLGTLKGRAEIGIARTPIDGAVYNDGAGDHRAFGREFPQHLTRRRIQGVHIGVIGGGIHRARINDAVRHGHRPKVDRRVRIRDLPQKLAGDRVERRP